MGIQAAEKFSDEEVAVASKGVARTAPSSKLELLMYQVISGTHVPNEVTVRLQVGDTQKPFSDQGNGPTDALCNALQVLAPGFTLKSFTSRGTTEGSWAKARSNVVLEIHRRTYGGLGEDPNTDVATAKAVVAALNRMRETEFTISNNN